MNAYQEEVLKAVDNLAAEISRVQRLTEQAFSVSVEKPSVDEVVTYVGQRRTINCCHTTPTPNERRAELIERAKRFHAEQRMQHNIHIGIYKNERKVEARCVQPDSSYNIGTAVIEEDAVFNLDIAKAIAVGRALEIDVSEFANAVQPTEWVVGMGLRGTTIHGEYFYYDAITKITNDDEYGTRLWRGNSFASLDAKGRYGQNCEDPIITDDTNAQY